MKNERIIIHCSDSTWGNAAVIDGWHKARGWSMIGYHWVILNGREGYASPYVAEMDGAFDEGRGEEVRGAHVEGNNTGSIGICLIGKPRAMGDGQAFTSRQWNMLRVLVHTLIIKEDIPIDNVFGHNDFTNAKICPGFDVKKWWGVAKLNLLDVEV